MPPSRARARLRKGELQEAQAELDNALERRNTFRREFTAMIEDLTSNFNWLGLDTRRQAAEAPQQAHLAPPVQPAQTIQSVEEPVATLVGQEAPAVEEPVAPLVEQEPTAAEQQQIPTQVSITH